MPAKIFGILFFILVLWPISHAWALDEVPLQTYPARLEFGAELRMGRFLGGDERYRPSLEPGLSLGLGWTPLSWLSVHGRIEGSVALIFSESLSYRWHKQQVETWHVGSLGAAVAVDFHLPSRLAILTVDVGVRSYFAPSRAGIFLIDAGVGLASEPFGVSSDEDLLQSMRFAVGLRFPIFDDFDTIFDCERWMPVVMFGVVWGY